MLTNQRNESHKLVNVANSIIASENQSINDGIQFEMFCRKYDPWYFNETRHEIVFMFEIASAFFVTTQIFNFLYEGNKKRRKKKKNLFFLDHMRFYFTMAVNAPKRAD